MSPARVPPPRNVRLFILFRALFNARFYYPVFTILFLDLGLTLAQFAVLNAVWAATIVALEVPLGALADVIGRRKLVVMAAGLMVAEMGLLCAAPRGRPVLLFAVLLVNRISSDRRQGCRALRPGYRSRRIPGPGALRPVPRRSPGRRGPKTG